MMLRTGLKHILVGDHDLLNPQIRAVAGGSPVAQRRFNDKGEFWETIADNSQDVDWGDASLIFDGTRGTVTTKILIPASAPASKMLWSTRINFFGATPGILLNFPSAPGTWLRIELHDGTTEMEMGNIAITRDVWLLAVFTYDLVADNYVFRVYDSNGGLLGTDTKSTVLTAPFTHGQNLKFGNLNDTEYAGCHTEFLATWDRPLGLAEMDALARNPYQIFAPKRIHVPLIPAIEVQAEATGDLLVINLVDEAGTLLTSLTGLSWAWFDESTVSTLTSPTAQGTGETTDGSGELSIDITGTTLTTGQTGVLTLMDSTGYIYALYRVTL